MRKLFKKKAKNENVDPRRNDNWRVILFSLVDATSVGIIGLMGWWSYYTQNVLKFGAFLTFVIFPMVLLDAFTDPLIANIFDKFESKYGKFKPLMILGTIVILIPAVVIFTYPVESGLPIWVDFTILIAMYVIVVFGSTILKTAARAGQAVITQDPKQRPIYSLGQTIFEGIMLLLIVQLITGDFFGGRQDPIVYRITIIIIVAISLLTIGFAILAISNRDNPKYYSVGKSSKNIKLSEYYSIIKRNKPLRRLIVATVSDSFAAAIRAGLFIYLFANVIQSASLYSDFDLISSIAVGLPVLFVGIRIASKIGTAKTFTGVAYVQTILGVLGLIAVLVFIPAGPEYAYVGFTFFQILLQMSL